MDRKLKIALAALIAVVILMFSLGIALDRAHLAIPLNYNQCVYYKGGLTTGEKCSYVIGEDKQPQYSICMKTGGKEYSLECDYGEKETEPCQTSAIRKCIKVFLP